MDNHSYRQRTTSTANLTHCETEQLCVHHNRTRDFRPNRLPTTFSRYHLGAPLRPIPGQTLRTESRRLDMHDVDFFLLIVRHGRFTNGKFCSIRNAP